MEGSSAHGRVDLDSLTNFPQVIMPPKFKALKFVKYDGTRDHCVHFCMFCRKMSPYGDNHPHTVHCKKKPLSAPHFYIIMSKKKKNCKKVD